MFSGLDFISNLFGQTGIDPYKSIDPGKLLARSGRAAVRSERDLLLRTFGFDDTISTIKDESQVAAPEKVRKKNRKNTLL